jgi:hypothetical protein
MSQYVVWLDSENARLFAYQDGKVEKHHLARHEPDHHTHSSHDTTNKSEHFFHQLCEKLTGASQVLLLGPVLARDHFQSHLKSHHHAGLAKKIVGSEPLDHPTDNQVEAFARKFFKEHQLSL